MKKIVSVLSDSPLYFTMTLRDRYELVKRLQAKEAQIDLSRYQLTVGKFLKVEELDQPKSFWGDSPFDRDTFGSGIK
jgi:hypothetical protein